MLYSIFPAASFPCFSQLASASGRQADTSLICLPSSVPTLISLLPTAFRPILLGVSTCISIYYLLSQWIPSLDENWILEKKSTELKGKRVRTEFSAPSSSKKEVCSSLFISSFFPHKKEQTLEGRCDWRKSANLSIIYAFTSLTAGYGMVGRAADQ